MRISVRSSICQAASPRPLAFQGLRSRTQTGHSKIARSPQEATPSPGEPVAGVALRLVPGCGEEIILFEGPLGVTREEYRVAPMADDGTAQESWPASLSPPMRPLDPPGGPGSRLAAGSWVRGLALRPVRILTGG